MFIRRCMLTYRPLPLWKYLARSLTLFASLLLLSMASIFSFVYSSSTAHAQSAAWKTFHDPIYGFSLLYPGTWTLTAERDGSHITLLDPATRTTISPIITTQAGTAATILKQALPSQSIRQQTRTIAGHPAIDYLLPYVPQPQMRSQNQDTAIIGGPQQTRQVVIPVTNTAGTSNVYTFLLTQPTSVKGTISAAEQADQSTFETILNSFTLPTKVVSSHVASATPNATGCDRICWADANVQFTDYTATATVPLGYGQPNYQCAEFVSRAITQDGMLPGLNNGGVNGNYFPASDDSTDGYGYGSYLAGNGIYYHLWNVGVTGVAGLHDYLTDSGLATNIGQDTSKAQPGDAVFFYDNGPGTDYTHTMIIAAIGSDGTIYLDGHNVAEYHEVLADPYFEIYHFPTAVKASTTGITTAYNGQQWTVKMQPDNHIEISNRQRNYYFTDTTKDTPSIAFLNGKVFVAFLGNDNANQIHFFEGVITNSTNCPSSAPCHFPGYILYNSSQTAAEMSSHGPALSSDATHLYLAFTGTEAGNTGHIHIEQTTNGTTSASWTNRVDLAGTTGNAPSTTALNGQQWVAYRGTDGRINLATSQSNYTFTDTTNDTPAISFLNGKVFVAFLSSNNNGQIHLFDGTITGSTNCPANRACHFTGYVLYNSSQTTPEKASGSPGLASAGSSLYLAFPGTEAPPAHAHIEETTSGTSSASWGNRADLGA